MARAFIRDARQKHLSASPPTSAVCFLLQEEVLMCVAKHPAPKLLLPTSTSTLLVDAAQFLGQTDLIAPMSTDYAITIKPS